MARADNFSSCSADAVAPEELTTSTTTPTEIRHQRATCCITAATLTKSAPLRKRSAGPGLARAPIRFGHQSFDVRHFLPGVSIVLAGGKLRHPVRQL